MESPTCFHTPLGSVVFGHAHRPLEVCGAQGAAQPNLGRHFRGRSRFRSLARNPADALTKSASRQTPPAASVSQCTACRRPIAGNGRGGIQDAAKILGDMLLRTFCMLVLRTLCVAAGASGCESPSKRLHTVTCYMDHFVDLSIRSQPKGLGHMPVQVLHLCSSSVRPA